MPLPQDALVRQQAAIFDVLGEPAQWEGVADVVRVKRREADETIRTDFSELIGTGHVLKVRKSEVAAPAVAQQVQILDVDGLPVAGGLFEVVGEPMLDRRDVWTCPVKPVA